MVRPLLISACGINQIITGLIVTMLSFTSINAHAVPSFARQTGQNCVACHAGGQFPELTPYGRLFKLTGYTIGQRALPLSAMAVVSANKVKVNPPGVHTQDGTPIFNTASLFVAGKISDKTGGFVQITYDNYADDDNGTTYAGHTHSDNLDLRYADRLINAKQDLIYGLTLHNNPGVQDVWNSTPPWGYGVVPGSTGVGNGLLTKFEDGLGQQVAGIGAYAYWNKTVYAELTGYRTGDGVFSFMTQGNSPQIYIKGTNPYARLALTHEWGPHNVMIGLSHFDVHQYMDMIDPTTASTGPSGPTDHYRDTGIDFQYQYLLDPYTVTATLTRIHENIDHAAGGSDRVNSMRAKASFTYQAKYGATLSYFNLTNTMSQESRGWTPEVFWTPVQYVRLGMQYTMFNRNEDPTGALPPKASDNNTLFFYVWGAY